MASKTILDAIGKYKKATKALAMPSRVPALKYSADKAKATAKAKAAAKLKKNRKAKSKKK